MIRNKKGVSTYELLAYIAIAGIVISTIFVLISNSIFFYNRTNDKMNLINEGSRHLDAIQYKLERTSYLDVTECSDTTFYCIIFDNDLEIKLSKDEGKVSLLINNQLITNSNFFLTDKSSILIDDFGMNSKIVIFNIFVSDSKNTLEFKTTYRI